MTLFIDPADLTPFAEIDLEKALAMIADAEATAITVAPCLLDPDDSTAISPALTAHQLAMVKAVLRGALLRWHDSGSGAVVQQSVGPFASTVDNRTVRRGMFWPSEIEQLQSICSASSAGGVFAIDLLASSSSSHLPWCTLSVGGTYCSCGADIAGEPIYEMGG